MKEYFEYATKRKSVRKYEGKMTDEELAAVTQKLEELKPLCRDIDVEYEIVPCSETNCKWNAEYCLLCFSEEKPLWLQNVGYLLEQWDLYLASLDIGACWYGWGKTETAREGKKYAIMLCFGKCGEFRKSEDDFTRKEAGDFWKGEKYVAVGETARLAPSACNSQPWLVRERGNNLEIYQQGNLLTAVAKKLSQWFNKMDMGIFLAFLEMSLEHQGLHFERTLNAGSDGKKTPLAIYEITE